MARVKVGHLPRRNSSSPGTTSPQSGAPSSEALKSSGNNWDAGTCVPHRAATWPNRFTQAFQVAGAVVAVDHGHRSSVRCGDQIDLGVDVFSASFPAPPWQKWRYLHSHCRYAPPPCWWQPYRSRHLPRADRPARQGTTYRWGSNRCAPRLREGSGILPGAEHPGQQVLQAIGHSGPCQQFIETGHHGGVRSRRRHCR